LQHAVVLFKVLPKTHQIPHAAGTYAVTEVELAVDCPNDIPVICADMADAQQGLIAGTFPFAD